MQTTFKFSFYPCDFDAKITLLRNALQHIYSWMTANLLTLNTLKTEFLLIGLKQQLSKFHNCPIETTHSARNLAYSSMNISLSLTNYHHYPNLAILTSVHFAVSVRILTSELPVLLPHLLFTPNLTTAIHYTNLPNSQINRLQQIQNSLVRTVV